MRRVAFLLSVAALAACGGGDAAEARSAEAFREFARAVVARDADGAWELLSDRMKRQASREDFAAALPNLRDDYLPVAEGPVALEVELDEGLALAALEGNGVGPGARAAVLRREDGEWRVQLSELDLVYGAGDLDFQVNARREDRSRIKSRAWVDGDEAVVRRSPDGGLPTFRVRPKSVGGGKHAVVAYVEAGERSGAIAWTFGR